MSKLFLVIALCLCLGYVTANRIILRPANEPAGKMNLYLSENIAASTMKDTEIVEFIKHKLGMQTRLSSDPTIFTQVNPWELPRLNVLFALPGLEDGDLPAINFFTEKIDVKLSDESVDPVSALYTVVSGVPAGEHGILGKSMPSSKGTKRALVDEEASPFSSNINDKLASAFQGSRQITFSYSEQYASVLALHPTLRTLELAQAADVFFWDVANNRIANLQGKVPLSMDFTFSEIEKSLQGTPYSFILHEFDAFDEAERAFIIEVAFINAVVDVMERTYREQQTGPDSFSVVFASLELLGERIGKDSDKFLSAAGVASDLIERSLANLEKFYGSRILAEMVLYEEKNEAIFNAGIQAKLRDLVDYEKEYLPYLYDISAEQMKKTCGTLAQPLNELGLEAVCLPGETMKAFYKPTAGRTETQVMSAQLLLWTTVILFVSLIGAVILTFAVGIPEDSILIRQTPNLYKDNLDLNNL